MAAAPPGSSLNFAFLEYHNPLLDRLGAQAERYFKDDPNTSLLKLRQFGELLAQTTAAKLGVFTSQREEQNGLLRRLRDQDLLGERALQLFHELRIAGNDASHDFGGDHRIALSHLKYARELGIWFHRTFGHDPQFKPGPFVPPPDPRQETQALKVELERLRAEAAVQRGAIQDARAAEAAARSAAEAARLAAMEEAELRALAEQLLVETEKEAKEAQNLLEATQAAAVATPAPQIRQLVAQAQQADRKVFLDEAETRRLIDIQLRGAGWEADSETLIYARGTRPEQKRNLAIAEWPVEGGRADYALFVGLEVVAIVEAKRQSTDIPASVEQAKRYSRTYRIRGEESLSGGPWGEYQVPFVFATNGRPYLKQLETKSGIWFCDLRRPDNLSRALQGWYAPGELLELLQQDQDLAHDLLEQESFATSLGLRDYQQRAILAVEEALAEDRQQMLLAMATGTGKTKTAIILVYRLLKTRRFRRVLFLVDRNVLGEQTATAFRNSRMVGTQNFADIFEIKDNRNSVPVSDAKVHIATIQSLVRQVLDPDDPADVPTVGQYDCIVVDECHRGYLLDRELSEEELTFRNFEDYVSKYRRVIDYFDAVKIGLTATPALHTTEIFGQPVYQYSYSEAVFDGWLIPYEPPVRIVTRLAEDGMVWREGEVMETYNPETGQVNYNLLEDEVKIEVEQFNRLVVTREFNRVICAVLAEYIDPLLPGKTLIFCTTDDHADLVVVLLKEAFQERYGSVDEDSVKKITGKADRPGQIIREFRNEQNPKVAVTVDLLTTGVDVPAITTLVFIRRVNSRILYEQMLGRATRRCDDIGKTAFRIFDAVDLYRAIHAVSSMKPLAVNPRITFEQLTRELATLQDPASLKLVVEQLVTKLQAKKRNLADDSRETIKAVAGLSLDDLIQHLRQLAPRDLSAWVVERPSLGPALDQARASVRERIISYHLDEVVSVTPGYGEAERPEDYLESFRRFVLENQNKVPALLVVTQRPKDLTRPQLRELAVQLAAAGYGEATLRSAWRDQTNEDIAATIIGFIRQAALGDALVPYETRVENAIRKILAGRKWSDIQRKWLQRIGQQLKAEIILDRSSFDQGQFRHEGGGFAHLNERVFEGKLETLISEIAGILWQSVG